MNNNQIEKEPTPSPEKSNLTLFFSAIEWIVRILKEYPSIAWAVSATWVMGRWGFYGWLAQRWAWPVPYWYHGLQPNPERINNLEFVVVIVVLITAPPYAAWPALSRWYRRRDLKKRLRWSEEKRESIAEAAKQNPGFDTKASRKALSEIDETIRSIFAALRQIE